MIGLLDWTFYTLTSLWLWCLNGLACCFLQTTEERKYGTNLFQRLVLGSLYFALSLNLLPLYLVAQLGWIAICHLTNKPDYQTIEMEPSKEEIQKLQNRRLLTFCTSNLLLGMNGIGKFQNLPDVTLRLENIVERFKKGFQTESHNYHELEKDPSLETSVISSWPDAQFLLLQEVWDRYSASRVMNALESIGFNYFVYDISRQSWSNNFCTGSSGLMLASKYPITAVEFHPFKHKKSNWQAFISYGVVMAKVDLDLKQIIPGHQKRRIGFVANLHLTAYQEKENLIGKALTLTQEKFKEFRLKHSNEDNDVQFAVIGGDFNFDNMSPGDKLNQDHEIFHEYEDICIESPGTDKKWSIGTELRQLKLYESCHKSPEAFRKVLIDDVQRRFYVIDADVQEQTMDLMYCDPKPDTAGKIRAIPEGGRRRIDRILFDRNCRSQPEGATFSSILAGQTDHIPFALTLRLQ